MTSENDTIQTKCITTTGDGMQLQSERGESPVCACLTCDRYVSVRFALVDGVHNLLWAADKPLSASLGNQRHSDVRDKYGDAGGKGGHGRRSLLP